MFQLKLTSDKFSIKKIANQTYVFDQWRKKYVRLTPEEKVRQYILRFLIDEKGYPSTYFGVEKMVKINGMSKRYDAILFNKEGKPVMILEFKAPQIPITQHVFDQVAVYNSKFQVSLLIISNGFQSYCCRINFKDQRYEFFDEIPFFAEIENYLLNT